MTNFTIRIDDDLIERALQKAKAENTTVEALVQCFLAVYARELPTREHLDKVLRELQSYTSLNASEWSRELRNER